ncbi:uncharacterized protein TRAVEDRAFT_151331 [Trametes versicolor FP-101664 SS1]|uniref:uncharacterized protein n=1 Tax=Trametes versicolor (strain FP-101664) TaxID=717944 RepID=UPI000462271E|nr:uncharacterized protein TRAVEDRAFT_151331 [Trametes versicolor FP-101664 SS1]EIW56724.1 hypothetical protein TRAVEDRAFT_151331 [Trametes versicolor FP-101664 SS1]
MPTLAELRSRAVKVKDAGVSSLSNTKDRMSSQPSKNINWNADVKAKPPPPPAPLAKPVYKPPPPPSRTGSSASSAPGIVNKPPVPVRKFGVSANPTLARSISNVSQENGVNPGPPPRPPPRSFNSNASSVSPSPSPSISGGLAPGPPPLIRRETRPDQPSPPPRSFAPPPPVRKAQSEEAGINKIDWANLSPEDKQAFFGWLDEFFSRYLGKPIPPRTTTDSVEQISGGQLPPPKLPVASRPMAPPRPSAMSSQASIAANEGLMSYPPPSEHASLAEDLAHYFLPSTHWTSTWYTSDSDLLAPPIRGNDQLTWTASWSSDGRTKTLFAGVVFADLSMCFYTVAWPQNLPPSHDPNDPRTVVRTARFLPRPKPWDHAALLDAHETYGETVAGYAESFEGTNQPCARGECWDLANEALKSFAQYDWVPAPVPSISRTHGHLMYEGTAAEKGRVQAGRWRGGDDRVRRGDIVEWRTARVGKGAYSWAMLGNPDHTAVIVSEMVPRAAVRDGLAVAPREMGTLEVIEQSLGKPPAWATYDLSNLEEGEVWIYRPVGMEAYVGCLLAAQCPEGVNAVSL